jgi:hypothetical protein
VRSFFFSLALCLRVVSKRNASGVDSWVVSISRLLSRLCYSFTHDLGVWVVSISIQVVLWPCLIYHAAIS